MRSRFKPWAKDYLQGLPFYINRETFSVEQLFNQNSYNKFCLEIGPGKGDFIVGMAQKFPDHFFLAIEMDTSVLGVAAQKIENSGLTNIKIIDADALVLLPAFLPKTVDYIFLNHSDPWPKKRHEKRRLTSDRFLNEYQRVLKKGGSILFKTDNEHFAIYTVSQFNQTPFQLIDTTFDYDGSDEFDALTEYEHNFRLKNVKIKRMIVKIKE